MVGQTLTDMAIRKLAAKTGERIEIWDSKVPGFGVRASSTGTKSFVLVYRFNGKPRRMTLGRYPVLSLSEAREMALEALRKIKCQSARRSDPGSACNLDPGFGLGLSG